MQGWGRLPRWAAIPGAAAATQTFRLEELKAPPYSRLEQYRFR